MHTLVLPVIEGFSDARIHHDGAWDGEAIVAWTPVGCAQVTVAIPAEVLQAFAEKRLESALDHLQELVARDPDTIEYQSHRAMGEVFLRKHGR